MIFGINAKLRDLLQNEKAAALLEQALPGIGNQARSNPQAGQLSVEQLVRYTRIPNGEALLAGLDASLQELNRTESTISPEEAELIRRFRQIQQEADAHPPVAAPHHQDAIRPGQPWLDTEGKRIQAHGGAVLYEDGCYYWYGENKEFTDGKNGVWTWGIRAYASADLCNWKDLGLIIPPELEDPNSSMFPAKRIDRPHILKCPATGKYVCWIKLSGPEAAFSVWQADRLLGPYTQVEALYNPGGYKIGDFDMVTDEETGKGYLYFDANHKAMVCMELTGDYLHAGREVARSYPDQHPPFTREGPCLFAWGGKKYMVTSGMTGYVPNQSDCAVAADWDVPFESIGNPHVGDETHASFNSQISKIFPVEGRDDLFIAMADRWLPRYPVDARIADLFTRVIGSAYEPETYQATDAERQEMYAGNQLETADTAIAEYVWLPVRVLPADADHPQGRVEIRWRDAWTPDTV